MSIQAKFVVADDQRFVRTTLRSLLARQRHWKVSEAENGKVALERVRKEKPHVAVLDIVMPEMSGIEAAYEIRRLASETKIILISSYYTPEEAAHLARLFGDGNFIPNQKPAKSWSTRSAGSFPRKARQTKGRQESHTSSKRLIVGMRSLTTSDFCTKSAPKSLVSAEVCSGV